MSIASGRRTISSIRNSHGDLFGILFSLCVLISNTSGEIQNVSEHAVRFSQADSVLSRLQVMERAASEVSVRQRIRLKRLGGLFALGRSDEAVMEWEEWTEADRDIRKSLECMHWYARTLISTGAIQRAKEVLADCLALAESPDDSMYFNACTTLLVDCHIQTGDMNVAIETARRFVQRTDMDDSTPLMLRLLGTAYLQSGNLASARDTWELLAESYPGSPEAAFATRELQRYPVETHSNESRDPDHGGAYVILIGSFRRADEADALYSLLRRERYPVIRKDIEVAAGPLTSILIGPYGTRERATAIRETLSDLTGREGSILLTSTQQIP